MRGRGRLGRVAFRHMRKFLSSWSGALPAVARDSVKFWPAALPDLAVRRITTARANPPDHKDSDATGRLSLASQAFIERGIFGRPTLMTGCAEDHLREPALYTFFKILVTGATIYISCQRLIGTRIIISIDREVANAALTKGTATDGLALVLI